MKFLGVLIVFVVIMIVCLMVRNNVEYFGDCPLTHPLDEAMSQNNTMLLNGKTGNCAVPYPPNGYPKTKCFSCESQSMRTYGTPRYGIDTKSIDAEETSKQVFGTYKYGETSSCFDCE